MAGRLGVVGGRGPRRMEAEGLPGNAKELGNSSGAPGGAFARQSRPPTSS